MKAVILEKIDYPLCVEDVEPIELQYGQVLVKVLISGLCGSQLLEIGGHKGNAKFVPHLMGHEGCGIVEKCGDGVTRVKPGDKVVMHWMKGEGIEAPFPKYYYNGKIITSGKCTTLSQFSICSENRLTPVDAKADPNFCALLGCCLSTGLGTAANVADIKIGESVLVLGCAGVGISAIMGAHLRGAYPIVALDRILAKRGYAKIAGAKYFYQMTEQAKEYAPYDVIIDTTGNVNVIENTLPMLANNGRYVLVGQTSANAGFVVNNYCHLYGGNGKSIRASQGGSTNPTIDIPRYVRMAHLIDHRPMVSKILPLTQINEAVELMRNGNICKILLDPWK